MTQIPSKPTAPSSLNDEGLASEPIHAESQTTATPASSFPSEPVQSSQTETADLKWRGQGSPSKTEPVQSSPTKTDTALAQLKVRKPDAQPLKTSSQQQPLPWWQRLSVRAKATALAVIIGTAPVLVIGGVAYYSANQSITRAIEQEKRNRATQLANEINVFMTDRFADIQILSQLPAFTNSEAADVISPEEKVALLDRYVELYGVYNSVALFDLEGETVVQAKGDPVPNHKTRDYFQRILQTGQPTINPPSISRTTGTLSMHLASPIRNNETDEITGVVRFQLPVAGLEKIAQEYAKSGDNYYVIDNSGKYFLASGNKERIDKPAEEHFAKYAQLQAGQTSGSVIDVDPDDGSKRLLTYVPIQDLAGLPELDFGVLIASDVKTAFAPQRQLLLTIEIGTAVTALLIGAIAAILANRATRPLVTAANAVKKIGEGELDTRLPIQGEDEIAVLGANINSMAAQLQSSLTTLAFEAEQERLLTTAKGSGVLRSSDLQNILDQAVEGARILLSLDRLVIYRFDSGAAGGIVAESVDADRPSALAHSVNDACIPESIRDAYRQGRIIVANDVSQAEFDPEHLTLLRELEVKASLILPIRTGDELFGLLIAHHCAAPYKWQEPEIDFLKRLANELALSMYRIQLLEQTINLAEEQRQLKESLQRRALELLQEVDPISQGDLTIRAKVTPDEIGTIADSYNATVDSLRKIVTQVQAAASQVNETTRSNEVAVQTLSQEALRQAEEIAAALQQVEALAEAVQRVAQNAEYAEAAVQEAAQTVEAGDAAMNRTVSGIQAIQATVTEAAQKVKYLGDASQKISTIVDLISNFAAQTNMLALNASIEASRAGEEGRGFAVVANEVRELAQNSAQATNEIKRLVTGIQAATDEVVVAMESGTEQVTVGTQLVDETRQSLNRITAASREIQRLVEMIAQTTVLQSQSSETVANTITSVAEIANQTSAEADRVSDSFKQLRQVAQTLQENVEQFKLN